MGCARSVCTEFYFVAYSVWELRLRLSECVQICADSNATIARESEGVCSRSLFTENLNLASGKTSRIFPARIRPFLLIDF